MNRRGFIKGFFSTTTFVAAGGATGVASVFAGVKNWHQKSRREAVIAQALNTKEGRVALAQAMVDPIKRALEYQGIGKKLLMVDELPKGALDRYQEQVKETAEIMYPQTKGLIEWRVQKKIT